MRRVSPGYALEHLQLAYASTVHGVQARPRTHPSWAPTWTPRASTWELTRGRHYNVAVAVAVATTDQAAREAVARSMVRGVPELSMADAARAAEAERWCAARARITQEHSSTYRPLVQWRGLSLK